MPHHDKKKHDKTAKLAAELTAAALFGHIFETAGFEKPEAVADYCIAIAKHVLESDVDDDVDGP